MTLTQGTPPHTIIEVILILSVLMNWSHCGFTKELSTDQKVIFHDIPPLCQFFSANYIKQMLFDSL